MAVEAPVFCGQHRLDEVVGQFLELQGIVVQDASLSDFVAVAVEECDGELLLLKPVLARLAEGGYGERQHDDATGRADIHGLAGPFERKAPAASHGETVEEAGKIHPCLARALAGGVKGSVDPRIDGERGALDAHQKRRLAEECHDGLLLSPGADGRRRSGAPCC